MEPFVKLSGVVAPIDRVNIDTDQVIPAIYLKRIERTGRVTKPTPQPPCVLEAMANIREAIELYLEPTEDDYLPQEHTEVVELAL